MQQRFSDFILLNFHDFLPKKDQFPLFLTKLYPFLTKKWSLCGNELASLDTNFLLERTCCSERSKALSCQQKYDLTSRRHFGKEVSVLLTSLHKMNRKLPVVLSAKVRCSSPGSAAVCVCSWSLGTWFLWGLGCVTSDFTSWYISQWSRHKETPSQGRRGPLHEYSLYLRTLKDWEAGIDLFWTPWHVLWEDEDGLLGTKVSVCIYIHTYVRSALWAQAAKLGTCWTARHLTYSWILPACTQQAFLCLFQQQGVHPLLFRHLLVLYKAQTADTTLKEDFSGRGVHVINYLRVMRSLWWLPSHITLPKNTMIKSFYWIKSTTL